MTKSEKRKGEIYIYIGAILWAFFPVITILSYGKLPSLLSLAWSTFFSVIFFSVVVSYKKTWYQLKNPLVWKYIFFIVLFIGVLFYSFYFTGLETTSAGNAGIIALFEVFTSFLFFNLFKKEFISTEHIVGSILMICGALIVLLPNLRAVRIGDFFILAATFFTPIGNYYQQKIRKIASSETIMFARSLITTPIIFLLAYLLHQHVSAEMIKLSLPYLLINGLLLFGVTKLFWIEAIHRISVTKGNALSSITPFLTLIIAWIFLKQSPNLWQLVSLIPLVAGVLLLTDQVNFKKVSIYLV
jgi:drug/metabolite transporter (DMT)-like permease